MLFSNTRAAQARLDRVAARLRGETLAQDIARRGQRLRELEARMGAALQRGLADDARRLKQTARLLDTLSHRSVLARGFALVTTSAGALVRRVEGLSAGDAVRLTFADGAADAVIGGDAGGAKKKGRPAAGQGSLF